MSKSKNDPVLIVRMEPGTGTIRGMHMSKAAIEAGELPTRMVIIPNLDTKLAPGHTLDREFRQEMPLTVAVTMMQSGHGLSYAEALFLQDVFGVTGADPHTSSMDSVLAALSGLSDTELRDRILDWKQGISPAPVDTTLPVAKAPDTSSTPTPRKPKIAILE